jgi:electron transfer flavoprotein alpha subunit
VKNLFVFCELDDGKVAEVSFELLTKGRKLATELGVKLEALVIGKDLDGLEKELYPYGVDTVWLADDERLELYVTQSYSTIIEKVFQEQQPQIALLGATPLGRDLGPRVSSALHSGLTADCTELTIGDHEDKKNNKSYEGLLYQVRPAFGGTIIATIINPDCRPQMATVREGVMKKEILDPNYQGEVKKVDTDSFLSDADFSVKVLERHIEKSKINIKDSSIIIAGGYGVGSVENFQKLHELADVLGGEVGATRAAVDAGYTELERQIGQTGVTVRPKLYIAAGISGQIQHLSGMQESSMIISINTDPDAPINKVADHIIIGDVEEVIPKMIEAYKANTN